MTSLTRLGVCCRYHHDHIGHILLNEDHHDLCGDAGNEDHLICTIVISWWLLHAMIIETCLTDVGFAEINGLFLGRHSDGGLRDARLHRGFPRQTHYQKRYQMLSKKGEKYISSFRKVLLLRKNQFTEKFQTEISPLLEVDFSNSYLKFHGFPCVLL